VADLRLEDPRPGLARELAQSIVLLALAGSSVGAILAVLAFASGALGR
jgi:hypothetical protein